MSKRVSKDGNQSRMISANGFWMRVYHRDDKTCYLCNFCPMGCNGLLKKLEKLLDIDEVAMFQEVNMAFIITHRNKGVPVYDLMEFLSSIKLTAVEPQKGEEVRS